MSAIDGLEVPDEEVGADRADGDGESVSEELEDDVSIFPRREDVDGAVPPEACDRVRASRGLTEGAQWCI